MENPLPSTNNNRVQSNENSRLDRTLSLEEFLETRLTTLAHRLRFDDSLSDDCTSYIVARNLYNQSNSTGFLMIRGPFPSRDLPQRYYASLSLSLSFSSAFSRLIENVSCKNENRTKQKRIIFTGFTFAGHFAGRPPRMASFSNSCGPPQFQERATASTLSPNRRLFQRVPAQFVDRGQNSCFCQPIIDYI